MSLEERWISNGSVIEQKKWMFSLSLHQETLFPETILDAIWVACRHSVTWRNTNRGVQRFHTQTTKYVPKHGEGVHWSVPIYKGSATPSAPAGNRRKLKVLLPNMRRGTTAPGLLRDLDTRPRSGVGSANNLELSSVVKTRPSSVSQ